MIATEKPRPGLMRPVEPMPPDLQFHARADACAVSMAFNGTAYRAVLDLDARGFAQAEDVAGMLESLAGKIRRAR